MNEEETKLTIADLPSGVLLTEELYRDIVSLWLVRGRAITREEVRSLMEKHHEL